MLADFKSPRYYGCVAVGILLLGVVLSLAESMTMDTVGLLCNAVWYIHSSLSKKIYIKHCLVLYFLDLKECFNYAIFYQ